MTMLTADVTPSPVPLSLSSAPLDAPAMTAAEDSSLPPELHAWLQGDDTSAVAASEILFTLSRKAVGLDIFDASLKRARQNAGGVAAALSPSRANELCSHGWQGTTAAAVLAPAWHLPAVAPLTDVPAALWGSYTAWLFTTGLTPHTVAQADTLARHLIRFTEELASWAERNLGSPAIRAAVDAYLAAPLPAPALLPLDRAGRWQLARARLLARVHGAADAARTIPFVTPTAGRPIRVGIIKRDFDASPSTSLIRARFAQLDQTRFETVLYATHSTFSESETACRDSVADLRILPERLGDQVEFLRAEALDVAVMADDLAMHMYPAAHLGLYRFAPLQVALGSSTSTGLPAIDLLLTGENDALAPRPTNAADRLAILPGTIHAYEFASPAAEDGAAFDRSLFGIPPEVALIVSTLNDAAPVPGAVDRLHQLHTTLADVHLLFIDSREGLDAVTPPELARLLDSSRVHVYPVSADNLTELRLALGAADAAVELSAATATLALDALTPVISCSPASHPEAVAGLLKTAGLDQWIATDSTTWLNLVQRALEHRTAAQSEIDEANARVPRFTDTFATAEDFGLLLEAGVAELQSSHSTQARKHRQPLRAATRHSVDPAELRHTGLRLLEAGDIARAVPYLLSAVNRNPGNARLWFDLAQAYLAAGSPENALSTLEASLRIDDSHAPAWVMLAQLAADVESLDLAREALDCAANLEPDHPELPTLRSRLAA